MPPLEMALLMFEIIFLGVMCNACMAVVTVGDNSPYSQKLRRDLYREVDELKDVLRELQRKSALDDTKTSVHLRRDTEEISNDEDFRNFLTRSCDRKLTSCSPGPVCPSGPPGPQGPPGRDGRDGRDGVIGYCKKEDDENDNDGGPVTPPNSTPHINPTNGSYEGAVFVRWGVPECPSSSQLLYSGIVGGAHYTHKGSGSNYLCLPEEPIYDQPQQGSRGQNRAFVYGTEYETNSFSQWSHLHDTNVPCSVCWARSRPTLVMVPARNVCPGSEWTKEYSGYLVSAHYNHYRSQFVCMDKNPETVEGTKHNANGALFYVTEGRCGSGGSGLPCGPYVDGNELTCAVCTR